MAKKKKDDNRSRVRAVSDKGNAFQAVFKLLIKTGVIHSKEDIQTNFTNPNNDFRVAIAVPRIKFALSLEGDRTEKLEENGWHIEKIAMQDIEPFARIFYAVDIARVQEAYSLADPNVKTVSEPEEKIMTELIRRFIPRPDRNYTIRREDGTELTTPDFTWEEYKIAFFMDGTYWHGRQSDEKIIKQIRSSKKFGDKIVKDREDKVEKDARNRRKLKSLGWEVLSCTDTEIATDEGLKEVVDDIEKVINEVKRAQQLAKSMKEFSEKHGGGQSADDDSALDLFFNDNEEQSNTASVPASNDLETESNGTRENFTESDSEAIAKESSVDAKEESLSPSERNTEHAEGTLEPQEENDSNDVLSLFFDDEEGEEESVTPEENSFEDTDDEDGEIVIENVDEESQGDGSGEDIPAYELEDRLPTLEEFIEENGLNEIEQDESYENQTDGDYLSPEDMYYGIYGQYPKY